VDDRGSWRCARSSSGAVDLQPDKPPTCGTTHVARGRGDLELPSIEFLGQAGTMSRAPDRTRPAPAEKPAPVCVGVTAYRPNLDALVSLLTVISQGGSKIWLFLNSPLSPDQKARLRAAAPSGLQFLNDGRNLGLGVAYNQIVEAARAAGSRQLMILDQDSSPRVGIAAELCSTYELLRSTGERPAVVGPLAVSDGGEQFKPPRIFRNRTEQQCGSAWPATFVISSGSLLDLDACAEIGPFREDFFIDAIDIEWCFRSWSRGFSCWIDSAVRMPHRLGQGTIRLPLLGMHLVRQPPSRLHTYVRNQVAMLRLPHIPVSWRLRIVPYLMFQGLIYFAMCRGLRWKTVRAFASGLVDGLRFRLGAGPQSRRQLPGDNAIEPVLVIKPEDMNFAQAR
jgi:rhamnosyltransferase